MDIGAQLARLEARLTKVERSSRLSSASLDGTSLVARDDTGGLRAIVGQQADGTSGIQVVNGPPPPAPSAPIAVSVLGGVTVSWDGQFVDGAVIPLDWARIEVHASTSPGFTPTAATLQSTIETAQGATVVVVTDDPVYVQLLARNTSGAASTPSAEVGPFGPTPVVASDVLDGIITTVKLADDAVTAAKVAAGAIGTTEITDNAVTTQKIVAGAILAGQIAAGAVLTDKLAAEAVTAAKIASLAITTDKLDANAVTTAKLSAGSVDATALKADAITGKTITGGTITGTDIIGATVTGGVLQTNTSGSRVVVTPTPPAGMVTRPTVLLYSGVTGEIFPAALNSGPNVTNSAQPTTVIGAPVVAQDSSGNYSQTFLSLSSPKAGSYSGNFTCATGAPTATSEIGYAGISATTATTTSGASSCNIYAKDGNITGKHSSVYITGDYVNITANGADHTFTSSGIQVTGSVMAQNTPYLVSKPINTDRISTTTRTADPHLTVSLLANATYIVEFHLYTGGSSFALTVTEWLVPSGATGLKGAMGPASSATETTAGNNNADGIAMRSGSHGFSTTVTYGRRNVNTNLVYAIETGTVTTTSAGTLALGWAQSTSSTTFNRMGLGSWMRAVRIA
ncbi:MULTISPECIES: hypothetical protein [unclassified Streptomyces]|uniref:hypothetical protein n=1 Tax=unclassified Streptomyces TaxID=2593676 RepID=UPI00088AEBD1|nr:MULTISPECIES: hypothetical protein [unclassified Streptomyces]PBC72237.1 hypothetical protein BX261_7321 [Streptomyces sp. 2321.6]SDR62013.1 hypothetical protein SAMN05216511_7248 [Streptomyces sp. KS_16]SEE49567.1 hypothetical protein SAMN05428940_7297 [Streptomyces sp. 2133.1]SNC77742.1 hypothetical protein SAMN06272741_7158 [Streptomyces sp. 2114.4]